MITSWTAIVLACAASFARCSDVPQEKTAAPPRAVLDPERIPRQPYRRYFTEDPLGRRVTFYLSEEPAGGDALPLVAYVQGSGAQSLFVEASGGRLEGRGGHNSLCDVARGRARLLVVEKPGVKYLDAPADPGGATGASAEFREEHTLERWAVAVGAALEAARSLPEIRGGRALIVGHSEGGIVAAKVAADHEWITHVAVLAGGGPTQLFDLIALARRGDAFEHVSKEPETRVAHVLEQWRAIQKEPDSAEKLFFGHPYRRWSSFLRTSTLEQLLRTKARVYVAQGTEDRAVAWDSFETLRAECLARGREAVFDSVVGADHSFAIRKDGATADGWTPLLARIVEWFVHE